MQVREGVIAELGDVVAHEGKGDYGGKSCLSGWWDGEGEAIQVCIVEVQLLLRDITVLMDGRLQLVNLPACCNHSSIQALNALLQISVLFVPIPNFLLNLLVLQQQSFIFCLQTSILRLGV